MIRCVGGSWEFRPVVANQRRRRLPCIGDKRHFKEVALKICGVKHWLSHAVDETGIETDVLIQRWRDK